jgi:hypothetical protein
VTAVTALTLEEHVVAAIADGFEVVQEGRVLAPPALGVCFSERVEGFRIGLLGYTREHTPYANRIFDDDTRWVHLRKDRR